MRSTLLNFSEQATTDPNLSEVFFSFVYLTTIVATRVVIVDWSQLMSTPTNGPSSAALDRSWWSPIQVLT
jgi:hypothetical protein